MSCSKQSTEPEPKSLVAVDYAWVELGPEGKILARAITPPGECPSIQLDTNTRQMQRRSLTPPPGFEAIQVCEFELPAGTRSASINGQNLAIPSRQPKQIVVLGDTGCRIKGTDIQNCTGLGSGPAWNFHQVAETIAALEPDLIIHVGDYHYRESPCPPGNKNCEGSPYGYNWASWEADFFQPAKTLLPRAAWVFVRGNHEDCERAWKGWFYFLDPRPLPTDPWQEAECQQYTDPYRVPTDDLSILVMDTAEIPDDYAAEPNPKTVARYAEEFTVMDELAATEKTAWLTTHRPFWAVASYLDTKTQTPQIAFTDLTLQAALKASVDGGIPDVVKLLIAGHIHLFELLTFTDGRPPQLVFGGGGTELDPPITDSLLDKNPSVLQELGVEKQNIKTVHEIDFAVIESASRGWKVTIKRADGRDVTSFAVDSN